MFRAGFPGGERVLVALVASLPFLYHGLVSSDMAGGRDVNCFQGEGSYAGVVFPTDKEDGLVNTLGVGSYTHGCMIYPASGYHVHFHKQTTN